MNLPLKVRLTLLYVGLVTVLGAGWATTVVTLSRRSGLSDAATGRLTLTMVLTGLVALVLAGLGGWLLARGALRPVGRMTATAAPSSATTPNVICLRSLTASPPFLDGCQSVAPGRSARAASPLTSKDPDARRSFPALQSQCGQRAPRHAARASRHAMRTLDPQSLTTHVDRLYRAAWALCGSREDAEDLVQETFARVLSRPRVIHGDDDLYYLMRVLRNTFLTGRNKCVPVSDNEYASNPNLHK